ncbi:MAG: hypothetical protein ACTHLW_11730 [Verrucomicrobiota bacterium]
MKTEIMINSRRAARQGFTLINCWWSSPSSRSSRPCCCPRSPRRKKLPAAPNANPTCTKWCKKTTDRTEYTGNVATVDGSVQWRKQSGMRTLRLLDKSGLHLRGILVMLIPEANIAICQNRPEQEPNHAPCYRQTIKSALSMNRRSLLCKRPAGPAAACILPLKLHAAAASSAQGGAPNPKRGKSEDTNNQ